MPPNPIELQTPWIRAQLIDWLIKLSNNRYQEQRWASSGGQGESILDEVLDFFDDSGVLAEPRGRVGFVLVGEDEVVAMQALNLALDRAISSPLASDVGIIQSQAWADVVDAARKALVVMGE